MEGCSGKWRLCLPLSHSFCSFTVSSARRYEDLSSQSVLVHVFGHSQTTLPSNKLMQFFCCKQRMYSTVSEWVHIAEHAERHFDLKDPRIQCICTCQLTFSLLGAPSTHRRTRTLPRASRPQRRSATPPLPQPLSCPVQSTLHVTLHYRSETTRTLMLPDLWRAAKVGQELWRVHVGSVTCCVPELDAASSRAHVDVRRDAMRVGVFTSGDAPSFSGLTSKITPLGSMLN